MAASLCWTLLFLRVFVFVSAEQKIITAESGQDVTLTCRAPNNNIIVVKWSRADLGEKHVLIYRSKQFVPANQHPSFKNRVDLKDRQMKDGDVSVILKDVMINDTGSYECRVIMEGTHLRDFLTSIYLRVDPPEQKIIPADPGQSVTLTCRAPNNNIGVKWSRTDMESEYVLLYRDGQFVPDHQHPSFKNRVDLRERQMKDGDVSVILKDVTVNDVGTYACAVLMRGVHSWTVISSIYLRVVAPPGPGGGTTEDGGKKDGSAGWTVALIVLLVLTVFPCFAGLRFYKTFKKQRRRGWY